MIYMCDGGPTGRFKILIKLTLSALLIAFFVYVSLDSIQ
jgi:hypothetical protein